MIQDDSLVSRNLLKNNDAGILIRAPTLLPPSLFLSLSLYIYIYIYIYIGRERDLFVCVYLCIVLSLFAVAEMNPDGYSVIISVILPILWIFDRISADVRVRYSSWRSCVYARLMCISAEGSRAKHIVNLPGISGEILSFNSRGSVPKWYLPSYPKCVRTVFISQCFRHHWRWMLT